MAAETVRSAVPAYGVLPEYVGLNHPQHQFEGVFEIRVYSGHFRNMGP